MENKKLATVAVHRSQDMLESLPRNRAVFGALLHVMDGKVASRWGHSDQYSIELPWATKRGETCRRRRGQAVVLRRSDRGIEGGTNL
jgi:hypothetical protein